MSWKLKMATVKYALIVFMIFTINYLILRSTGSCSPFLLTVLLIVSGCVASVMIVRLYMVSKLLRKRLRSMSIGLELMDNGQSDKWEEWIHG